MPGRLPYQLTADNFRAEHYWAHYMKGTPRFGIRGGV
jgi:hypothetical protein